MASPTPLDTETAPSNKRSGFTSQPRVRSWALFACQGCVLVLLLALALVAVFVPTLLRDAVDQGIEDRVIVDSADAEGFDRWESNAGSDGVPILRELKIFNVTNPLEVLAGARLPQLERLPPLVYDEFQVKNDITFSEDGNYATYNVWTYYRFNEAKSQLARDAPVVMFSPLVGTLYHVYDQLPELYKPTYQGLFEQAVAAGLFTGEMLFVAGPAEEVLFHTLNLTLPLGAGLEVKFNFVTNVSNVQTSRYLEGYQTTRTGKDNPSANGEMFEYRKNAYLQDCVDVNFSDPVALAANAEASQYVMCWSPPQPLSEGHENYYGVNHLTEGEPVNAWVHQLARTVRMDYLETVDFKDIDLYRYNLQVSPQFDNVASNPANAQFDMFGPPGIINMTSVYGTRGYLSLPMFLYSPVYAANLSAMGLPEPEVRDNAYLDVEPRTGAIFRANKSLQLNWLLHSLPLGVNFSTSPLAMIPDDLMVPVLMLAQYVELTDDQASDFSDAVGAALDAADALEITGYVALALLLVIGCAVAVRMHLARLESSKALE